MEMTGFRSGKLVVLSRVERTRWLCQCDCGKEKIINQIDLRKKRPTESCGCIRGERIKRHGEASDKPSKEYRTWTRMKTRCYNPKDQHFDCYGGRGIVVSPSWLDSFETFLKDMGRAPSKKHQIDRQDTNQGYNKDNCRWATQIENSRNKRTSHLVKYNGTLKHIFDHLEEEGVMTKVTSKKIKHNIIGHWVAYKKKGLSFKDFIQRRRSCVNV